MTPRAQVAVVAGSGIRLDPILEDPSDALPFRAVPGLTETGIAGHAGTFRFGRCAGLDVVIQSGRLHLYEGLAPAQVMATVDALAAFGVRTVLFTNAVGGLLPHMQPGHLMAVRRVDLWPCRAWPGAPSSMVPDLTPLGDSTGVYRWVHGPSYETRAEVRALQRLGAAAVGMSTAPELWRCRCMGIRAGILSCVTNCCCEPQALTHDHVVQAAAQACRRLCATVTETLALLASDRPAPHQLCELLAVNWPPASATMGK